MYLHIFFLIVFLSSYGFTSEVGVLPVNAEKTTQQPEDQGQDHAESAIALKPGESDRHTAGETLSVNVIPHKAMYDIGLLKTYGDDDIADVKGWMSIQVIDTTDGWAIEQKSSLIVYDSAGEGEQINTTSMSWESKNGVRYRFFVRTLRNGNQEELIRGDACKSPDKKTCVVNYDYPEGLSITIPGTVVFPMNHLVHSLQQAISGKNIFSNIVFDGSSETHEPVDVNTILGGCQKPNLIITTGDDELFREAKVWPMNMAVYSLGSTNADPDYEIAQTVMEPGVIKGMTLDYGSFKVQATIKSIELFK